MKHLRHPNIVRLFEVIDDPDQDLLFMCMEFVTGGDLLVSITQVRTHGLA
jgi:serine/threonine protein kinase